MKILLALVTLSAMCCLSLAHQTKDAPCYPGECDDGQLLYCYLPYSHCLSGTCKCYQGYVYSDEVRKCLLEKKVGEACRDDVECPTGSKCTDNYTCDCNPTFEQMPDFKACRDKAVTAILGDTCIPSGTTKVCKSYKDGVFTPLTNAASFCVNTKCVCPAGTHIENGNTCDPKPTTTFQIGSACAIGDSCPVATSCAGTGTVKTCTCITGHPVNGNSACLVNTLAANKNCDSTSSTVGCAGVLICGECPNMKTPFSTCTNSIAIISKPPVTTVGTAKVLETTQSFGLRNGASQSVFSMVTAILAVLAFLM